MKRNTRIAQRAYKKYYGDIPKEENGKSYHIHHKDGNYENNDPCNLVAVTALEHYNIHFQQGDYGAAYLLYGSIDISKEDMSKLSTLQNLKRVKDGTHPWLGGKVARETQRRRVAEKTHQWCDSDWQRKHVMKRVEDGTHNFLGGKIQKENQRRLLQEGKHTSQIKKICTHCGKTVDVSNFGRWHGNNCKQKKLEIINETY